MNIFSPFLTRLISTLTAFFFIFTTITPSLSAALPSDEGTSLRQAGGTYLIPSSLGRVSESTAASGNGRLVVAIQDLHCHPEVQRNISGIIEALSSRYTISRIFLEGASGTVDLSWYDTVTEPQLKETFIESLMAQGKLSGATYFALKHPAYGNKLFGLENKELHAQNLVRLSRIMDSQAETARILVRARESLSRVKQEYLSGRHRRLDNVVREYHAGRTSSDKYYTLLANIARKAKIDIDGYRNIACYRRLREMEQRINYRQAGRDLQLLMGVLREQLPYAEYRELVEKAAHKNSQDELLDAVAAAIERHQLVIERGGQVLHRIKSQGRAMQSARAEANALPESSTPTFSPATSSQPTFAAPTLSHLLAFTDLDGLIQCKQLNRQLDPIIMLTEEKRLVRDLRNCLSESQPEREVGFLSDYFRCLEDCMNAKLTAYDYAWFTAQHDRFARCWVTYAGEEMYKELEPHVNQVLTFYAANIERNRVFMSALTGANLNAAVSSSASASFSNKSSIDVIVTGGFHTEGLSKLLKDQGIPYVIVTPQVTHDTSFSDTVYRRLIDEQGKMLSSTIAALETSQLPAGVKAWTVASIMVPALMNAGRKPQEVVREMAPLLEKGVGPDTHLTVTHVEKNNEAVYALTFDNKKMVFKCVNKGKNRWELKENPATPKGTTFSPEELALLPEALQCLRQSLAEAMEQKSSHNDHNSSQITMLSHNAYEVALFLTGTKAGLETAAGISTAIIGAFKKEPLAENLYKDERKIIGTSLARTLNIPASSVKVEVSVNRDLIHGDAWAMAAMKKDSEHGTYILFVSEEFIKGLVYKNDNEKLELLEALGEHEGYEYDGVVGVDKGRAVTSVGILFRSSLVDRARTVDKFHLFLKNSKKCPATVVQQQKKLFLFAEGVAHGNISEDLDMLPGKIVKSTGLTEIEILSRLEELSLMGYKYVLKHNERSRKVFYKKAVFGNWGENTKTKELEEAVETLSKMEPGAIGIMYAFGSINERQRDVLTRAALSDHEADALVNKPEITELLDILQNLLNSYHDNPYKEYYKLRLIPCSEETQNFIISHCKNTRYKYLRDLLRSSDLGLDVLSRPSDRPLYEIIDDRLAAFYLKYPDYLPYVDDKKIETLDKPLYDVLYSMIRNPDKRNEYYNRVASILTCMKEYDIEYLYAIGTLNDKQRDALISIKRYIADADKKIMADFPVLTRYNVRVERKKDVKSFITTMSGLSSSGIVSRMQEIEDYCQSGRFNRSQQGFMQSRLYGPELMEYLDNKYHLQEYNAIWVLENYPNIYKFLKEAIMDPGIRTAS